MVQADELAANVKKTEAGLSSEQKSVESDRRALATEMSDLRERIERLAHVVLLSLSREECMRPIIRASRRR